MRTKTHHTPSIFKPIPFISKLLSIPKQTAVTIFFQLSEFYITMRSYVYDNPSRAFDASLRLYRLSRNLIRQNVSRALAMLNTPRGGSFFGDETLRAEVSRRIEEVKRITPQVHVTINKYGVIMYETYKKNAFNTLLLTVHSGSYMPAEISLHQRLSDTDRYKEEDVGVNTLFRPIILKGSGIWIDSALSRYACDYNRPRSRSIYSNASEPWVGTIWKTPLSSPIRESILSGYDEFYVTLRQLITSYRFQLVLDAHTMKDDTNRPSISFGTEYIPQFYMPVVHHMMDKSRALGYSDVVANAPYKGGYIVQTIREQFPNVFICSVEINKKLYMNRSRSAIDPKKLAAVSRDIASIFDFS